MWWPVAVHPAPRRALQISYGLGTTSRALVETRELEHIDVVDTSASVLKLSALAQESPAANPLADPRVHAHIEDGRFFLLTTPLRYDLITADPPPPKAAGIASLYSREYFSLVRSRLAPGGMTTYWLPVYQMNTTEARAIIGGFCAAFDDCSLWTGHGLEWILIGTRDAKGPVSAERFSAQWRDPVVSTRLREAGFDDPSQLGALFLADAPVLRSLVAGVPPLDDDHPYRLSPSTRSMGPTDTEWFVRQTQVDQPLRRFFESELVKRLWPEEWREPTRAAFLAQDAMNATFLGPQDPAQTGLVPLDRILALTSLYAPVLWAAGTNVVEVRRAEEAIARGEGSPMADEVLGLEALARRDYREADRRLGLAEPHASHALRLRMWRVLALGLAGDREGCARLLEGARDMARAAGADLVPLDWLARRFAHRGSDRARRELSSALESRRGGGCYAPASCWRSPSSSELAATWCRWVAGSPGSCPTCWRRSGKGARSSSRAAASSRRTAGRSPDRSNALGVVHTCLVPDGERFKSRRTLEGVYDAFLKARLGRDGLVLALGGGVVGDLAGFAAASWMRGVDWVVVPTTLLAMVDSSIGGKVGINHARAKNMIGAFHQPRAVVIDPAFLATLPMRELRSGAYEILKCAVLGDAALFARLRRAPPGLEGWERPELDDAIATACRIKAEVVEKDEREGQLRYVLNLGHTIGHALEAVTGYRRYTHGEAVGWGMIGASWIAQHRGLLAAGEYDEDRLRGRPAGAAAAPVGPQAGRAARGDLARQEGAPRARAVRAADRDRARGGAGRREAGGDHAGAAA